ncbi:unnamed protein product [Gongylonema pulchrum]|uniref:Phlebovirus glycoprotein G2 fusion domain-containing protein n=1 Tax=Gongylonema pulchrum TaxID=637853 RepID=A0A183DQG9_9BILA|nr:unnamed protein product [Gongylonema pulchrum]
MILTWSATSSISHGCSTLVVPKSKISGAHSGCDRTVVLLKTSPVHRLQAEYCFCTGDGCNVVRPVKYSRPDTHSRRFRIQDAEQVTHQSDQTQEISAATANRHIGVVVLFCTVLQRIQY